MEEYGREFPTTILCIPALFLSGDCFLGLKDAMPDAHWVFVTLDGHHPGSGDFPTLAEETERLARLLRDRGLTRIDLCIGLSLGTIVAVSLAERPEVEIRQLLLDGAVSFHYSGPKELIYRINLSLFRMGISMAKKGSLSWFQVGKGGEDPWRKLYPQCMAAMSETSLGNICRTLVDFTPRPGLTMPITCFYGAKESNLRGNRRVIAACYPQARFRTFPGCSHLGFLNSQPQAYAGLIRELVGR